jgi:DNA-binding response OmpR family regulator
MAVLSDGRPHTKYELLNAIDEQADEACLAMHLSRIRKKLEPRNKGILYTAREGVRYQLVPTMPSTYEDMTGPGRII